MVESITLPVVGFATIAALLVGAAWRLSSQLAEYRRETNGKVSREDFAAFMREHFDPVVKEVAGIINTETGCRTKIEGELNLINEKLSQLLKKPHGNRNPDE